MPTVTEQALGTHTAKLLGAFRTRIRDAAARRFVKVALPLAAANPLAGITAQTLAAALVTHHYIDDPSGLRELLEASEQGERARAKSYAARVLLELLQNAEDAYRDVRRDGGARVWATQEDKRVWVWFAHSGKAFDADDLDAFRRMYGSAKTKTVGRIGQFGVGIKSLLAVADSIELHSGGYHLLFEPREHMPLFFLPWPCRPRQVKEHERAGGGVLLRMRWADRRATPKTAVAALLKGFRTENLAFLSRLRSVEVEGVGTYALKRTRKLGSFARFDVASPDAAPGAAPRTLLRIEGEGEVALGLVAERAGRKLTIATTQGRAANLHAFFPMSEPSGTAALLHGPFRLKDDRESVARAERSEIEHNADVLRWLAVLSRQAVDNLAELDAVDGAELPKVLLGDSAELSAVQARLPESAGAADALASGMGAGAVFRALALRELADAPLFTARSGRSRSGAQLLFGGEHHDLWEQAVDDDATLPTSPCALWLAKAPRLSFGVADASVAEAHRRFAAVKAKPAVQGVRPMLEDDGRSCARLKLVATLSRVAPEDFTNRMGPLPLPVTGPGSRQVFLEQRPSKGLPEALGVLDMALVDWRPFREVTRVDRAAAVGHLEALGTRGTTPFAVLEACDRVRRLGPDVDRDAALLMAARIALGQRVEVTVSLEAAWERLFRTTSGWATDGPEDRAATVTVWASRLRVPVLAGDPRPACHTTSGRPEGTPPELCADVDAVAELVGLSATKAKKFLRQLGVWPGVPLRVWCYLPWPERRPGERGALEFAEMRAMSPAEMWDVAGETDYARSLYALGRQQGGASRRSYLRDFVDDPDPSAAQANAHGWKAPKCGGYLSFWSDQDAARPLGHAALPEDLEIEAVRQVIASESWATFAHVPLWQPRYGPKSRYQNASPRRHFPSLLLHSLRQLPILRRDSAPPLAGAPASPSEYAAPEDLYRVERYPSGRGPWASSAARSLPLVHHDQARRLLPRTLDLLQVVSLFGVQDLRHLLRALHLLSLRDPSVVAERRALGAAHDQLWQAIARLVDLPRNPKDRAYDARIDKARARVEAACVDAAMVGLLPPELRAAEQLPTLTAGPAGMEWRTLAETYAPTPQQCAFYDPDPVSGARGRFGDQVGFVELPRNHLALAKMLGVPIFRPKEPQRQPLEGDPGGACAWLQRLVADLLPFVEAVVTRYPASGGDPMAAESFAERVDAAGLKRARFEPVKKWPSSVGLEVPPGARVDLPVDGGLPFRFVPGARGRKGVFLVHHGLIPDVVAAQRLRWRLDRPLARALESMGHAPFLQNLLRALDPDAVGRLRDDAGLTELVGSTGPSQATLEHLPEPTPGEGDLLGWLFSSRSARAAAIVLVSGGDVEQAVYDTVVAWARSRPMRRLADAQGATVLERLAEVFGLRFAGADFEEIRKALLGAAQDDPLYADIETRLRRAHRLQYGDQVFASLEEVDERLGPLVDALPLPPSAEAVGIPASAPTGKMGGGAGGRFARPGSVTGRIGERYAARWLAERHPGKRVCDVSTIKAREEADLPARYQPAPPEESPGVDVLVFEDGLKTDPVGYEVKARRGDGPLAFEWTRNEHERCRRVLEGEPGTWPLADYRVLTVSNLAVDDANAAPSVALLQGQQALDGAAPKRFAVRASLTASTGTASGPTGSS